MGLLTDPGGMIPQKAKYVNFLIKYNKLLCSFLYIVGIGWFICLADINLNHGTYFSENALLPGLVYSEIKKDTATLARNWLEELHRERETYKNSMPYPWLLAKMRQIGLDTHTHNFTLNYPLGGGKVFRGKNVYGILRAPRIGSTESIVISAPYRNPDSTHPETTPSIPLMLAFADFARKQKYWAKDIIFLITEKEQLGMQAWLEAYYGYDENSALNSGNLEARAGAIQAAVNLELQNFDVEYINIKLEGLNGQLPNLDLVNLVQKLSIKEGIPCGYKQKDTKRRIASKNTLQQNFLQMISMVLSQSSGVPTGNHGLFHRYGIEAVTLEGVGKSNTNGGYNAALSSLKVIEGIVRSLNNLLEKFHQSFFFYLIVASDRFVSIGDYMPSLGLMAGCLLVKALILWLSIHKPEDSENENEEKKIIAPKPKKNYNILTVGSVLIAAHSIGFLASYLPFFSHLDKLFYSNNIPTEVAIFSTFFTVSILTLFTPIFFNLGYLGTEILHISALLELGTTLIVIGMLNFSLGLIIAVVTVPFGIFVEINSQAENKIFSKIKKLFCLSLHPLLVVYLIVLSLTVQSFPELSFKELLNRALTATMSALTFSVVDSIIYGNWMFNLISVIFFPVWLLFWNVLMSKDTRLSEKIKKE